MYPHVGIMCNTFKEEEEEEEEKEEENKETSIPKKLTI